MAAGSPYFTAAGVCNIVTDAGNDDFDVGDLDGEYDPLEREQGK